MADGPPPTKRIKYNYDLDKTFNILVGREPNQQRFTVHQDLLTQRSEFFKAARSSRWTQADTPTIFDDHDPEVFSTYVKCLYFGADAITDRLDYITNTLEIGGSEESSDDPSEDGDNHDSTLWIGHLSSRVDGPQIARLFSGSGARSVRLAIHRDGRSKGYGFVNFVTTGDATRALTTHQNCSLDQRSIRLELADGRRKSYIERKRESRSVTCKVASVSLNSENDRATDRDNSNADSSDQGDDSSDDGSDESSDDDDDDGNNNDNDSSDSAGEKGGSGGLDSCDHIGCCSHFADCPGEKFLVDLYLLADKLIDITTVNLTMDAIIAFYQAKENYADASLVEFTYDSTAPNSPLRRLFRDYYIHTSSWTCFDAPDKAYHEDFLRDLVREVWTLNRSNLDKSIKSVYDSDFMNDPGDRYHRKTSEVSPQNASATITAHKKET